MRRRAKIDDVAHLAQVSKMTVSLCLREDQGHGRASAATRARVVEAARQLGYRPNTRARALRTGRTNVFAFYAGHGYVNVRLPFFTEIVSGLQEGCELARRDLLLHGTFHTASSQDLYGEFVDGRIDGLIASMRQEDPLVDALLESDLAFVAAADQIDDVPSVLVDDAAGGRMMAEHLYEAGDRKVLFAIEPGLPRSGRDRMASFMATAAGLGMHASVIECNSGSDWLSGLQENLEAGFTAISCWNDVLARQVLDLLRDMGRRTAGRIGVTGFDGCPLPVREEVPLTTIAAPWCEVAKTAVLTLNARLAGEAVRPRLVLPVRFVRGATT